MSAGSGSPEPSAGRPVWKRAGLWIGGIVTAALGAVLVGYLTQGFGTAIAALTRTGPPVAVRVEMQESTEDVALPQGVRLSADDFARLAERAPDDQVGWLQEHAEGVVLGTRTVVLTLRGNRPHQVRITDLQPVQTCSTFPRGTMLRMVTGRGAGVDSTRMNIDVGDRPSDPYVYDETENAHPYFPDRTITLAADEEIVVIVDLNPGEPGRLCRVELELTVWDGDTQQTQRISDDGTGIPVMWESYDDDGDYESVYLGGELCTAFVPAVPEWGADLEAACGPGNLAPR